MSRSARSFLLLFASLAILLGLRAFAGEESPVMAAAPWASTPPAEARAATPPPVPAASGSLAIDERLRIETPVTQGLVTLYPVVDAKTPERPDGEFQLLKEALEAKSLTVEEAGGGTVPTLMVRNTGDKPVLLVAGDVVKGGKQDRVITSDFVVAADGTPVDVAVNCVEHGRWSAGATGHSFGWGGRGEASLKKVVQVSKNQSATWNEVETSNGRKAALVRSKGKASEAAKLAPESGTYVASLENEAVLEEVNPATASLITKLQANKGVVGVVVAVGDSITTAELFGHPALFERSREDLVRSFVLDGVGAEAKGDAPEATEAAAFLREALQASRVSEAEQGDARKVEMDSVNSSAFETTNKDGSRIHFNAYKK
ncbi:MAG: hypothetical protein KDA24_05395 [Deltaproteobacteria bacterium]|nr:hypothetical protein [Deltaproteobacteria bacterium]